MLIEPVLSDDALVADIESVDPGNGVALWWLGQSGFLIKHRTGRILLDPYLSDSLTRKYAETEKPHVRMTRRVVAPSRLSNIDLVTSSHNHTDHLDAETLIPVLKANPKAKLIIPEANRTFVSQRLQMDAEWPVGLTEGQTELVHAIRISAVPAAHNEIDRDGFGRCHYLGYVVQFNDCTIYHSGDTLRYPGMADLLRSWDIDIALLPINGNRPERQVAGNLWGDEAAKLAADCGAKVVIPCHFEMFQFNTESPQLFAETCDSLRQAYQVLRCGQRWHYCRPT